jgi:ADP-heptose:LPS heptosyltransferase
MKISHKYPETRILVRRRAALGDAIMATGVVRELHKRFPQSTIDVATEFLDVFNNNPHINHLYHTNAMPDPSTYDMYVDLDDAYESVKELHYLDCYFYRAFGTDMWNKNMSPELFPTPDDSATVQQFVKHNQLEKYICIHIRQWYWAMKNMAWDTWYAVFEKLFTERTDFKIVCVGSEQDGIVDHPLFVDARGKLNLQQTKLLMDGADCFVGIDSGPYHIASASKTSMVSLHTHLLPERVAPTDKLITCIKSEIDCVGCNELQPKPVRQINCIHGPEDFRCSRLFDADKIAKAVLDYL